MPDTKPKILVIEDEVHVREALEQVLAAHGYEVTTSVNVEDGWRDLARVVPDLVLTDIFMPERDGIGVIWELRRTYPKSPIVAMSGGGPDGGEQYLRIARSLGACATLQKPFTVHDVLEVVRHGLALASVA